MVTFKSLPYIRKFLASVTFLQQIQKSWAWVKTSVCTVKYQKWVIFTNLPYIRKFLVFVTFSQQIHQTSVSVKTSVCTVKYHKGLNFRKLPYIRKCQPSVQFLFILFLLLTVLTNCYFILSGGAVMSVPSLTINMWALTRMRARTGIIGLYTSFRSSVV